MRRNILLAVLFSLGGVLGVLVWSQPALALAFLPLGAAYAWLQVHALPQPFPCIITTALDCQILHEDAALPSSCGPFEYLLPASRKL